MKAVPITVVTSMALQCAAGVHDAMVRALAQILDKRKVVLEPAEKQGLVKLVQAALLNLPRDLRITQVLMDTNVTDVNASSDASELAEELVAILGEATANELHLVVAAAEETHFVTIMDSPSRIGERISARPFSKPTTVLLNL